MKQYKHKFLHKQARDIRLHSNYIQITFISDCRKEVTKWGATSFQRYWRLDLRACWATS